MPMLRETKDLLPESSDYAGPAEKTKSIWTFPKWGIWFQSLDWLFVAVGDLDEQKKKFQQQPKNRNLQSDKQNDVLLLQH